MFYFHKHEKILSKIFFFNSKKIEIVKIFFFKLTFLNAGRVPTFARSVRLLTNACIKPLHILKHLTYSFHD